jgi:hypothetical protein
LAGAALLAAGAVFLATALFCGATDRLPDVAVALRGDFADAGAFLAGAAPLFAVVAAFFTDAAFFVWWERFEPETDLGDDLFPAGFLAPLDRDPGALLGGVPLLAGVIVSSLTTCDGRFPGDDLAKGAGDDSGSADPGQYLG